MSLHNYLKNTIFEFQCEIMYYKILQILQLGAINKNVQLISWQH